MTYDSTRHIKDSSESIENCSREIRDRTHEGRPDSDEGVDKSERADEAAVLEEGDHGVEVAVLVVEFANRLLFHEVFGY